MTARPAHRKRPGKVQPVPLPSDASQDRRWIFAAAIIAMTLLAYLPAYHAGFIWDDDNYVWRNPLMDDPGGWRRCWIPGTTPQYYPLVFTMFWIEHALWGMEPAGYHIVNVLIHAVNAVLVWKLASRLKIPGAWMIGAAFALHPVHVESVAWITERKNMLSALFYLLAAHAYLRFDEDPKPERENSAGRWRWYAAALALFVAALLSKSVTCSLPAALTLMMLWQGRRLTAARLAPLAPFFVIGLILALHTASYERSVVGAEGADFRFSFLQRMLIAANAIEFYAFKLIWPRPIMFVYPRWNIEDAGPALYAAIPVCLAVLAASLFLWRRGRRGPFLSLAFFAGTLVPALGFFNVYPFKFSFVADHFQYLASLGVLSLAIGGLASAIARQALRRAVCILVLFGLGGMTFLQSSSYESAETVWRDTLGKNEDSWMPQNNLASILLQQAADLIEAGDDSNAQAKLAEAENLARRSLDLRPDHPQALSNLSEALRLLGRREESLEAMNKCLHLLQQRRNDAGGQDAAILDSHLAEARWKIARLQELLERTNDAEASYRQAVVLQPADPMYRREYVRFLRKESDRAVQANDAARAVRLGREAYEFAQDPKQRLDAAFRLFNLLLAAQDSSVHDPEAVIRISERLLSEIPWNQADLARLEPYLMRTLAAAQAAAGRPEEAASTAARALDLARRQGSADLASSLTAELERYRSAAGR